MWRKTTTARYTTSAMDDELASELMNHVVELTSQRDRAAIRLKRVQAEVDEMDRKIAAIKTVLEDVLPSAFQGGSSVAASGASDPSTPSIADAVRKAAAVMDAPFEVGEICDFLKTQYPDWYARIDPASIGGALSRLAKNPSEPITIHREGSGRRPALYIYTPSTNGDSVRSGSGTIAG